jgi:hypothetical protein
MRGLAIVQQHQQQPTRNFKTDMANAGGFSCTPALSLAYLAVAFLFLLILQ